MSPGNDAVEFDNATTQAQDDALIEYQIRAWQGLSQGPGAGRISPVEPVNPLLLADLPVTVEHGPHTYIADQPSAAAAAGQHGPHPCYETDSCGTDTRQTDAQHSLLSSGSGEAGVGIEAAEAAMAALSLHSPTASGSGSGTETYFAHLEQILANFESRTAQSADARVLEDIPSHEQRHQALAERVTKLTARQTDLQEQLKHSKLNVDTLTQQLSDSNVLLPEFRNLMQPSINALNQHRQAAGANNNTELDAQLDFSMQFFDRVDDLRFLLEGAEQTSQELPQAKEAAEAYYRNLAQQLNIVQLELEATRKQLADEDFALEHLRMRDWIAYSMRRLMELNRDMLAGITSLI
jgi:hypothetical protein